ncbi:Hypothetical transmembrane protein [Mycoplasma mycoides subsp. mycoides SC str. PG1]|uniref:Hypothetical transmembrane protein n=1 Tax=Mycoplasma mycoides subsp. mycoides SC (strain CCUG 32753 / NCTC 10114 / PG1) TaxID=272632 RepID=Q6MRY2_MYCMS|nr:Hypothetical transmembrane protein [Mycoplasma mycoides subsp. mycoides SC str. PG1]
MWNVANASSCFFTIAFMTSEFFLSFSGFIGFDSFFLIFFIIFIFFFSFFFSFFSRFSIWSFLRSFITTSNYCSTSCCN